MEIVSYPRGKVRRCFQGILIPALFYNKGTSFFYLFIPFYVTLEKRPLIPKEIFRIIEVRKVKFSKNEILKKVNNNMYIELSLIYLP